MHKNAPSGALVSSWEPPDHLPPNAYAAECPTRRVLDRIADKWTVLILGALRAEPMRFNALKRRIGGVSQKMLAQTLRQLERDGLVSRTVYPTVPVMVEYAVTPLGATLGAVMDTVRDWAEANIDAVQAAQDHYDARGDAAMAMT